jgi:hypothetical protein
MREDNERKGDREGREIIPNPQEPLVLEQLADLPHRLPLPRIWQQLTWVSTVLEYQGDLTRAVAELGTTGEF